MEVDATRMCELLVGLPDVNVLGVETAGVVRVLIETRGARPCCGAVRRAGDGQGPSGG